MSRKLDINESALGKHIAILKSRGAIERIGGLKGYWKVVT